MSDVDIESKELNATIEAQEYLIDKRNRHITKLEDVIFALDAEVPFVDLDDEIESQGAIKELNDRIEAQDKIINFLVQCGDTKSAELRHLREKIRSSPLGWPFFMSTVSYIYQAGLWAGLFLCLVSGTSAAPN